jgi:hypothetical protein
LRCARSVNICVNTVDAEWSGLNFAKFATNTIQQCNIVERNSVGPLPIATTDTIFPRVTDGKGKRFSTREALLPSISTLLLVRFGFPKLYFPVRIVYDIP